MGQDWARCQRMMQHEQHRYEELRNLASQVNPQLVRAEFLHVQARATNADPAIDQVLQALSALQKQFMLHHDISELDTYVRLVLNLRFRARGRAKLLALVGELRQYNNSIVQRLAIPVTHPPQGPIPSWPPPVPRMF